MSVQYLVRGRSAAEIVLSAEEAIRQRRLQPGDRLPPVRALAQRLGISPATAAAAYRELRRRGLTRAEGRRGTRVAPTPPVGTAMIRAVPPGARDLANGYPDPALLPRLEVAVAAVASGPAVPASAEAMDIPGLVVQARRQFQDEGIDPGGLAVVGGALDGVERVLRAQLHPGDRVAVEDPGFPPLFDLLAAMGLERRPVAVDDRGMLPARLRAALESGAQAVVLTPRAQNPTGAALDPDRAAELHQVLHRHPGALLIEDDHAGPIAGAPTVTTVEPSRPRWAVVRSVSKWLGPDLRLAVLAADATTLARVQGQQRVGTGWVSQLLQRLVERLWTDPATARLSEVATVRYRERRQALVDALAGHGLPARGRSGLNVWVSVADETRTTADLLEAGWAVAPGQRFRIATPPAVRVTISHLDPAEAPQVAELIARSQATPGGLRPY